MHHAPIQIVDTMIQDEMPTYHYTYCPNGSGLNTCAPVFALSTHVFLAYCPSAVSVLAHLLVYVPAAPLYKVPIICMV